MIQSRDLLPMSLLGEIQEFCSRLSYWDPVKPDLGAPSQYIEVDLAEEIGKERPPRFAVVPSLEEDSISLKGGMKVADGADSLNITSQIFEKVSSVKGHISVYLGWLPPYDSRRVPDVGMSIKELVGVGIQVPRPRFHKSYAWAPDYSFPLGSVRTSVALPRDFSCPTQNYQEFIESATEVCLDAGFNAPTLDLPLLNDFEQNVKFEILSGQPNFCVAAVRKLWEATRSSSSKLLVKIEMETGKGEFGTASGIAIDQYLEALWPLKLPWKSLTLHFMVDQGIFINPEWDIGASIFGSLVPAYIPLGEFDDSGRWTVDAEAMDGKFRLRLRDKHSSDRIPSSLAGLGLEFEYVDERKAKSSPKAKRRRTG